MTHMSHSRRLVVCCDGTWQSSVTWRENIPSNVTKLCRVIARDGVDEDDKSKLIQQIVYYDSGIGTGSLSSFEKSRQGGLGDGLTENVIEAYNFIVNNYEAGDEIFCFGFSRGAYTARAVAGLVTDIGVIKPQHMQDFPEIYLAYKLHGSTKVRETTAWQDIFKRNLDKTEGNEEEARLDFPNSNKVKVVGVWDTVGALGVPDGRWKDNSGWRKQYAFHNVKLGTNIEHAFHALALDERRKAFSPTLWYIPHELIAKYEAADRKDKLPELKQCWFPGVHINIGGGSDDGLAKFEGDMEAMANISFAWMLQCISKYLTIDQKAYEKYLDYYFDWTYKSKYQCTHHSQTWGDTAWSYTPWPINRDKPEEFLLPKKDASHTHSQIERGWGIGPFIDSAADGIFSWAGGVPRHPGEPEIEDETLKPAPLKKYGVPHEYMHPVAAYRQPRRPAKEPKNAPPRALDNFSRPNKKGRYWWVKKGDFTVEVPEWIIMGGENDRDNKYNFERRYYERCLLAKNKDIKIEAKKNGETAKFEVEWLKEVDSQVDFEVIKAHKDAFDYP